MGSIQTAERAFQSLGFRSLQHTPYKAPENDEEETARIRRDLANLDDPNPKMAVSLETELSLQTVGIPEILSAFKSYDSFKGMRWTSPERPYIMGIFTVADSLYHLEFLARYPDEITDPDFFRVHVGMNIYGEECNRFIEMALSKERERAGITDEVNITTNHCKILIPPFRMKVSSDDSQEAYNKLLDAMNKVGWREPHQYVPVKTVQ